MTNAFPEYANLLGNILYPIGFIAIVLGGYQLFTENTLTPVTLILNRRASIIRLLRLWGIVLLANISGAGVGAFLMARTGIFDSDVAQTAMQFGEHALSYSWADLFFKAVIAGGIVATMVWLIHAVRDSITLMFMVPASNLFHCVTGTLEVLYFAFRSSTTLFTVLNDFFIPVVLGNISGGIIFVSLIVYGMTGEREIQGCYNTPPLSIKRLLFGNAY